MKAIKILYTLISSGNDDVFANKNTYEKLTLIAEAIEELEGLENKKCESCKYFKPLTKNDIYFRRCLILGSTNLEYCSEWELKC